jgi:hypothetical protein
MRSFVREKRVEMQTNAMIVTSDLSTTSEPWTPRPAAVK